MKRIFISILMSSALLQASSQSTVPDSAAIKYQQMMAILHQPPKIPIKTIGIFVYDGFNTLDAIGPYQTLSQLMGVKVMLIAKKKGMVRNQTGLGFEVTQQISEVPALDMLLIPGGAAETWKQTTDTAVLNWIKRIDATSQLTASVCTGAWILGAAGLLQNKKATTNWYRAEEMMHRFGARFVNERYVQDGKYWTSAGVTAGIDMSLAIINTMMSEAYTQAVMLDLEYNPAPPVKGGTPATSAPLVTEMMKTMYDMALLPLLQPAPAPKKQLP
jgi:transcriptional regulator GlxA family with amidase domain